jgi:hypothetical protein
MGRRKGVKKDHIGLKAFFNQSLNRLTGIPRRSSAYSVGWLTCPWWANCAKIPESPATMAIH